MKGELNISLQYFQVNCIGHNYTATKQAQYEPTFALSRVRDISITDFITLKDEKD
jgi:hypothetical protein